MSRLTFQPEAFFRATAARIATTESSRIRTLLPAAQIDHIGGTSIPGALTKGDVDLLVQVGAAEFTRGVAALQQIYAINQPDNWTPTFASFKDDTAFDLPFGAQLVVAGSENFHFLRLKKRLSCDPVALEGYNAIKRSHQGGDPTEYRNAKGAYIESLLADGGCERFDPAGVNPWP